MINIKNNFILFDYNNKLESDNHIKINRYSTNIKIYIKDKNFKENILIFINNVKINNKTIYISRHGESIYNTKKLIGGDSSLSNKGKNYSKKIKNYLTNKNDLIILTSKLKRTIETVNEFNNTKKLFEELNEIDAGIFDSMSYEYIKQINNNEYEKRIKDKLNYKYPKGESYIDIFNRLNKIILYIEALENENILIISHQAVIRVLMSYFENSNLDDIINNEIKLHNLYILKDGDFDYNISNIEF